LRGFPQAEFKVMSLATLTFLPLFLFPTDSSLLVFAGITSLLPWVKPLNQIPSIFQPQGPSMPPPRFVIPSVPFSLAQTRFFKCFFPFPKKDFVSLLRTAPLLVLFLFLVFLLLAGSPSSLFSSCFFLSFDHSVDPFQAPDMVRTLSSSSDPLPISPL